MKANDTVFVYLDLYCLYLKSTGYGMSWMRQISSEIMAIVAISSAQTTKFELPNELS